MKVEVRPGDRVASVISSIPNIPNVEIEIYDYGKNGYIVESQNLLASGGEWAIGYYIEHNDCLYMISFNSKSTSENVHVSIDGYGKVNY